MILKTINSKIGKVHCVRINRIVKKSDIGLRKEPFTFIMTDYELKEFQKDINQTIGITDEHLLSVSVKPKEDRRKAITTFVDPSMDRRKNKPEITDIFDLDMEIEV